MKINWINTFFAILCIILILWLLSSFFGFSIPNWRGVQVKTENAVSPLEVKTNITKAETMQNDIDNSYSYYYIMCETKCNENSDLSDLNGKRYIRDSYYFDNNSLMVCKCVRIR